MLFTGIAKKTLVPLFAGLIWLPLLVMLATPQQEVSELENRRLASAPEFDAGNPEAFPAEFESYFNDHFGFRTQLIRLFRYLEIKLFRVPRAGNVLFGRDGWLFEAGGQQIADMRNNWPFKDAELAEWARVLEQKQQALSERGIDYLFVLAPNKNVVYPDKLPASVNRVRDTSRADQLIDYLGRHTDVPVLDLRPVVEDARPTLRPYHRTDTHWNAWGAYTGYRALMQRLAPRFPGLTPVRLTSADFVRRRGHGGDLARSLSMQETLEETLIEPETWRPDCAVYQGLPADASDTERNNNRFTTRCARGSGRLLMFRDSYSLAMMPYLSETFAYVHYFPASPVPLDGMLKVIEEQNPDIVIEERATRWLRKPYG